MCQGFTHHTKYSLFTHGPAEVEPLEVRCAHPVRLSPATHSQGKAAEKEIGIERP